MQWQMPFILSVPMIQFYEYLRDEGLRKSGWYCMGKVGVKIRALYEQSLKKIMVNKTAKQYENNLSLL